MTLFADDVKMQARNERILQNLLTAASAWANDFGMAWNVGKCAIVRTEEHMNSPSPHISGQQIQNHKQETYLVVTATADGTGVEATIERIENTTKSVIAVKRAGTHPGTTNTSLLIGIWETIIITRATYGIHLVPQSNRLEEKWGNPEKLLLVNTMGCYSNRHRERVLNVGKTLTLPQLKGTMMTALQGRIGLRAKKTTDGAAKRGLTGLLAARKAWGIERNLDKKTVQTKWTATEARRRRRVPELPYEKRLPALSLKSHMIRRGALQWYCGTFPITTPNMSPETRAALARVNKKLDRLLK